MKSLAVIAALLMPLALAACGKSSSHAICTDNYKAADYAGKWVADLAAAVKSGKISKDQSDQVQMDMMYAKTDPDDVGAYCVIIDEQRKKLGL